MSRPLIVNGATTPKSLIEIEDNKIFTHAWRILDEFQSSNTNTGSLGVGSTPTGASSIGTFTDTRRTQAVGTHPAGTTITNSTTNFYQYNATETEDYARPLKWDATLNGIRESSNSDLNSHLIAQALSFLTSTGDNYGLGQYKLQPGTPSGGTWASVATITDKIINAAGTYDNNTTKLWKKTSQSGTFNTNVRRPLKVDTSTTPESLKEMTDTEIKGLVKRFSNRIIESGIGTYVVQENAPASGTWIRSGTAFDDDRRERGNLTYSGTYSGSYSGSRTYSGSYSGTYTGSYTRYRSGPSYAGSYLGGATVYYGGNPRSVNQWFVGYYAPTYTGYYSGNYTGNYAGSRNYSGNYSGSYTGNYAGATIKSTTEVISQVSLWMRTA